VISLLLAPAAHGKTAHALARIREVRARDPLAPLAVVLPNQIQLLAFRDRLAAQGGALGVSLFTFYGLYAELLARAGQPLPELDGPVQTRLLRALIGDLAGRGELRHFAPLRDKPGFAVALREAIEELKRTRILPEDFTRAASGLGPRLEELAVIYAAYQRWLLEKNWADPEGLGWLAAIALEKDASLGRELRLLVVDGFDEFNPTQLAVLAHLAARAEETLVTLTGDPRRKRLAHRRFHRAEEQLRAALGDVQWAAGGGEPRSATDAPISEDLRFLEGNLFEPPASVAGRRSVVVFLEAQTRAAEARAALRWIKQRIIEDGMALNDVAVLARSLDPYRPFLEETAREFGLPLNVVGGAPLAESPVVGALLSLLSLPTERERWRPRALLAAWRSPYFDWPSLGIESSHAATLDAVSRLGRVAQGLEQWREALARLAAPPAPWPDDEPESDVSRPAPEAAAQARSAFESFVARLSPPPRAPLLDYVAFVEDLIGDDPTLPTRFGHAKEKDGSLNVVARALAEPQTAARDTAALRAFKEVLRGLALAEKLLRAEAEDWDYAAFVHALREAVEAAAFSPLPAGDREASPEAKQSGEGPGVRAGVMFASVLDARGLSFRAAAVLGLAEGEFPLAEREMPLLRESDRAALRVRGIHLESRLRGDEVTIFYQAVTRARERLLLCRPYLADDGQQWEASAYWRQAHRLMGEPQWEKARPEDRLSPEQVASRAEWIEHGYDVAAIARGVEVLRARQAPEAAGPHEGQLPDLSPLILARFPESQSWSASRLEAYGTCGFYFYVAHVLKLEPRAEPEEGYDVRTLGNMYHTILERLYRNTPDRTNLDDLLARLPEVARAVFAAAPLDYGFRPTALWEQQQAELVRILRDTVTALAEKSEGWTPRYFEQRFGFGEKPLVVHTPHGDMRLHGYIDRIDVDAEGRLRIVDYKASGSPIAADGLKDGHRLQLPLYALAARDALQLGEVAEGFYWHIGRAEASSLKLEKFEGGAPGAFETAKQHLAAHVAGIRAGQFQPAPPEDGCPSYCPAVGFCWRYRPKGF
jgi:ATP-dependent helicase/DNAse subunit B